MKKILVMIALMLSFLVGNDAEIYLILGVKSYQNGDYNKSLEYFNKTLEIQKNTLGENNLDITLTYKTIASACADFGNYNNALKYYNKALEIEKQILGENHIVTASSYGNIGTVYVDLGEYNKALEFFKKALDIRKYSLGKKDEKTLNTYRLISSTYSILCKNYYNSGSYDKALECYKEALSVGKEILNENPIYVLLSYNDIGNFYSSLGNYKKALEFYNRVLETSEKNFNKENLEVSNAYNNICTINKIFGDYDKALENCYEALEIQKKIPENNEHSMAMIYNNLGTIYDDMKNYTKALAMYNKSLNIIGKNHPSAALIYNNIANINFFLCHYNEALEYLNKTLNIQKQNLNYKHIDIARSYLNISTIYYYGLEDYVKSYNYSKKAYEIYNFNKDKSFQILSSSQKKDFLDKNKNYIQNLLLSGYMISPSQDEKKEIYEYFINDKDDIFNSENILVTIASKDKNMKEKVDKLNSLKRDLGKLQANIPDDGDLKTYNEKIKSLENDIENKEIELSKLAPSFKEYHELKNITLKDLQAYLKDNELFIDFGYQGDNYYAFSMDKNGVVEFNMLDSNASKSLDEDIKTFRKDIDFIQDNINSEKLADFDKLNKSSKKTLAKINSTLNSLLKDRVKNYSSLIVSSDGALRLLPFEALYDGDKYLLEKYDIRYTPSAKEYIRTHRYNTNKAKQKATLFSDPNYEVISGKNISLAVTTPNTTKELETRSNSNLSGFLRLRGFKVEQNALQDRIKNISLYDREKANEENLFKLTSPEILHIITHGYFISDENIQNPMLKSGIALSGANLGLREKSDIGLVNALKLSGLELNGTNLIVLSACETGKVDINDTSSIASLPKTFIQAGARNVLMSLWKVEDKHTVRLMDELYSGKNYNQTLKEAKLSMIKENLHPFFWAAFILSGE